QRERLPSRGAHARDPACRLPVLNSISPGTNAPAVVGRQISSGARTGGSTPMNHNQNVRSDIARRLKMGRGRGEAADYLPWLTVQEVHSKGTSHRFTSPFGRTHHLFSDLEKSTFLIHQWRDEVIDVREQFPLLDSAGAD